LIVAEIVAVVDPRKVRTGQEHVLATKGKGCGTFGGCSKEGRIRVPFRGGSRRREEGDKYHSPEHFVKINKKIMIFFVKVRRLRKNMLPT
jgi:hypothetical protein